MIAAADVAQAVAKRCSVQQAAAVVRQLRGSMSPDWWDSFLPPVLRRLDSARIWTTDAAAEVWATDAAVGDWTGDGSAENWKAEQVRS